MSGGSTTALRTELQRTRHRHRRAHAESARDIAGGRDDAAPSAAADDQRLVGERRVVALLDRGVEGVAIDMGDFEIVADRRERAAASRIVGQRPAARRRSRIARGSRGRARRAFIGGSGLPATRRRARRGARRSLRAAVPGRRRRRAAAARRRRDSRARAARKPGSAAAARRLCGPRPGERKETRRADPARRREIPARRSPRLLAIVARDCLPRFAQGAMIAILLS